jgi:AcrR family transcriptional regulator
MARQPAPGTRDRILDNAARLFYEHGVHAVGLQQVIDESSCGKNLLYREFASKDDLVLAWLERCRDDWPASLDETAQAFPDDPAGQLLQIVRNAAETSSDPGYRGCALRNTHAEFADPDHPAHRIAVEHLEEMLANMHDLAERAGARDPAALANRLMLILDGLLSNAAILGNDGAAAEAVAFAEDVIAAATRPT